VLLELSVITFLAHRRAALSVSIADEGLTYKFRRLIKIIPFEAISRVKLDLMPLNFGLKMRIHSTEGIVKIPALERLPQFLQELKNGLDARGLSDRYEKSTFEKSLKFAFYGEQSWERLHENSIKFLCVLLLSAVVGWALASIAEFTGTGRFLAAAASAFCFLAVHPAAEFILMWRGLKAPLDSVSQRDRNYEKKVFRTLLLAVTAAYLAAATVLLGIRLTSHEMLSKKYAANGRKAFERGLYTEAENMFSASIREAEARDPQHPRLVRSLTGLAEAYEKHGRLSEAEFLCNRALAIGEKVYGPDHQEVSSVLSALGIIYRQQGRYTDAETMHMRALDMDTRDLDAHHPNVAIDLANLAAVYTSQEHYEKAEMLLKRSLLTFETAFKGDEPRSAFALNNLGALYVRMGRYQEAIELLARAEKALESLNPEHPDLATVVTWKAKMHYDQGEYAEAEELYQRELELNEKSFGPDHQYVVYSLRNLAHVYFCQEKYAEAEAVLLRAVEILKEAPQADERRLLPLLKYLIRVYEKQGRLDEVERLHLEILRIQESAPPSRRG